MKRRSQQGASLLIALIMLILITLLAVSSIQESPLKPVSVMLNADSVKTARPMAVRIL